MWLFRKNVQGGQSVVFSEQPPMERSCQNSFNIFRVIVVKLIQSRNQSHSQPHTKPLKREGSRYFYQDLQTYRHVKDFISLFFMYKSKKVFWGRRRRREEIRRKVSTSGTDECAKQSMNIKKRERTTENYRLRCA